MKLLLVPLICLMLSSCATIMSKETEEVPFRSKPVGALVQISDGQSCHTPCALNLKRGKSYTVSITKNGFPDKKMLLDGKSTNGWIWGNILIGGLIGLAIDYSTDRAYGFSPDKIDVDLVPTKKIERNIASENKVY